MANKFTLELDEQDLQVVGAGLSELAYKTSASVINKINKQIQDQLKQQEQAKQQMQNVPIDKGLGNE